MPLRSEKLKRRLIRDARSEARSSRRKAGILPGVLFSNASSISSLNWLEERFKRYT